VGLPPLLWSFPPTATFTSFPTPDCWACAAAPAFSSKLVYLQLTWEVGLTPFPVEFSSHCHFYKLSRSWLLDVCHRSCLLQPVCCEGFPLPPSSALRTSRPLCYVSFLLLLLIIQGFFLFSLGGGQSVQGAMLIWPRVVCGSTACCLAHLVVCIFPSHLGAAVLRWHGSPLQHLYLCDNLICTLWGSLLSILHLKVFFFYLLFFKNHILNTFYIFLLFVENNSKNF
jgi:hypothetical protein